MTASSLVSIGPAHATVSKGQQFDTAKASQKRAPRRTSAVLRVLGRRLLLPLCLGLLDQALLAGVFAFGLGMLSTGGDRRLVIETVDETGNKGRIAQNLDGEGIGLTSRALYDDGSRADTDDTHVDTLCGSHLMRTLASGAAME